mgnify:CR=1 FL=1
MLIEFKVIRIGGQIVGVTSNSDKLEDRPADLPLYSKEKIEVSFYNQPPDVAESFHRSLMRQMK